MGIATLPLELLTTILGYVRLAEDRNVILPCLLVSRHWSNIARPLAWDSIVLNTASLTTFLNLAERAPYVCNYVRSLSLQLNSLWASAEVSRGCKHMGPDEIIAPLWNDLERLADTVHLHMRNLVSFSLRISKLPLNGETSETEAHYNEPWGVCISTSILERLLKALPEACIDLELDTKGREDEADCRFWPGTYDSAHLCLTLQNILPRLRHFRLRLKSLCPSLFTSKAFEGESRSVRAPGLLSMTINLNLEPNDWGAALCAGRGSPGGAGDERDGESDDDPKHYGRKVQARLCKALQRAHQAAAFPQAKTLQLVNLLQGGRHAYEFSLQQDIVKNRAHILPFRLIWVQDGRGDDGIFFVRDRHDQVFLGFLDPMDDRIEDGAWITTVEGYRWSTDFRRSGYARLAVGLESQYETRAQFYDRCGNQPWDEFWQFIGNFNLYIRTTQLA